MVSSFYWVVDPSDAPYSVVALFLDDKRNIFEFFFLARTYVCIFFEKRAAEFNPCIEWRSDCLAVFSTHVHHSFGRVIRSDDSFRLLRDLVFKPKNFLIFFIFSPLAYCSWCIAFLSKPLLFR